MSDQEKHTEQKQSALPAFPLLGRCVKQTRAKLRTCNVSNFFLETAAHSHHPLLSRIDNRHYQTPIKSSRL